MASPRALAFTGATSLSATSSANAACHHAVLVYRRFGPAVEGPGLPDVFRGLPRWRNWLPRVARLIPFREAARVFGFGKSNFAAKTTRLVEAGLLEVTPFGFGREKYKLSVGRAAVMKLLARIAEGCDDDSPAAPVTFSELYARTARQHAINGTLVSLIKLLLDHDLRGHVAAPDENGLG